MIELKARLLHTIAFGFPGRSCTTETARQALADAAFDINMAHLRAVAEGKNK